MGCGDVMLRAVMMGILVCTVATANRREEIIKSLLNDSMYDSRIPPNYENDFPTNVTIQLFLLSFDSVTETSMDYSVTVFLRVQWTDKRLEWHDKLLATHADHDTDNLTVGEHSIADDEVLDRLEVDIKLLDSVWMPDIYFVNDKKSKVHDVTTINRMLHIHRNGSISTSARISMSLSCDMHLRRYPHDEQTCFVAIGSYSYSVENVLFHWSEQPVIIRKGVTLPRFDVRLGHTGQCDFTFDEGSMITGEYACIKADFLLRREFGYYVCQVYVPSCLIVMLSWVSFWIDLDAIPARVSLGLLTVLTMTTQSTGEKASLPKVSYIKAIDVWMAGCLAFVFAALLEFAYVNVQSRVEKRYSSPFQPSAGHRATSSCDRHLLPGRTEQKEKDVGVETEKTLSKWNVLKRRLLERDTETGLQKARLADKCARVFFPLAFLIFNIIYWVIFKFDPQ
ncbi:glycine receptor subunit alpha-2-like [Babylonia areolata]|uniref:glycine receptor subunit alpha-2-like n=1 Tax=Babylonia areolata TaxID=304850 RepID=UPI003FD4C7D6